MLIPHPFTGQPGVGKTCLVYRYLYNTFGETISVFVLSYALAPFSRHLTRACVLQTIGASFAMKKVESGMQQCNLGIWVPAHLCGTFSTADTR